MQSSGEIIFLVGLCSSTPQMPICWKLTSIEDRTLIYEHTSNFKLGINTLPNAFQSSNKQNMANAKCYFPDGSIATNDTPCNSAATSNSVSACCGHSDICLDNALCLMQHDDLGIVRGSCTDETWQSPECAQYCPDGNRHLLSIAPDLVQGPYAVSLVSSD